MHILDRVIGLGVTRSIAKAKHVHFRRYRHSEPLRILIVGYSGKNNTGAEVRIAEIIKFLRKADLGVTLQIGVLTLNPAITRRYVPDDVELVPLSSVFFKSILDACNNYHVGLLAEGSCLTSVTSNVAALFFICALGILRTQGKLCIGVGVDGGQMEPWVERLARRYAKGAHFFARSEETQKAFMCLGLDSELGTDTAWTIDPCSRTWASAELVRQGLKTDSALIGVSIMNPFIRPIRPSLAKYLRGIATNNWRDHYDKWYFYTNTREREELYARYLAAIVQAIERLCTISGGDAIALIEMEPMDRPHLDDFRRLLGERRTVTFSAQDYDGREMTSLLRHLDFLVTSRYHAHVLAMGGGVPGVAISKDARLDSIFAETGLTDFCLSTHDPALDDHLITAVEQAWCNRASISEALLRKSAEGIEREAVMADAIAAIVRREVLETPVHIAKKAAQ